MNILSINFNHDGAAALVRNGDIAGYACTERFSRVKKHPGVREQDLVEVLDQGGVPISDVDLVQLLNLNTMDTLEIPQLYGSTLKETWPDFWVNGSFSQVRILGEVIRCDVAKRHHFYHAALAYLFSPFESAVSFACDPVGAVAYFFVNGQPVKTTRHRLLSPGLYAAVAQRIFGTSLIGAGKLMGLAPYGIDDRARLDHEEILRLRPQQAMDALVAATKAAPLTVSEAGIPLNASLAYHAQTLLEHELSRVFVELHRTCVALGIEPNLCLSGGTALNSTANQRCFAESRFERLYLHPACGDDGMPLGAALAHWHFDLKQPRRARSNREAMYSCRTYDHEIDTSLRNHGGKIRVSRHDDSIREAARLIADGKVVGWFQGASEIGPRALGNRSILADPRREDMKDHLNGTIKHREMFRPFAPSVLAEHAEEWFGIADSPFMLRVTPVAYGNVPAVTHVDGTSRVQTVRRDDNPRYYDLIASVFDLTHVPMVLNTSFNGKKRPIVETPNDAIECMLETGLDAVVFSNCIVTTSDEIVVGRHSEQALPSDSGAVA